jgi:hypothetical protein
MSGGSGKATYDHEIEQSPRYQHLVSHMIQTLVPVVNWASTAQLWIEPVLYASHLHEVNVHPEQDLKYLSRGVETPLHHKVEKHTVSP